MDNKEYEPMSEEEGLSKEEYDQIIKVKSNKSKGRPRKNPDPKPEPKAQPPKVEEPKPEPPKVEEPKPEPPKVEEPKKKEPKKRKPRVDKNGNPVLHPLSKVKLLEKEILDLKEKMKGLTPQEAKKEINETIKETKKEMKQATKSGEPAPYAELQNFLKEMRDLKDEITQLKNPTPKTPLDMLQENEKDLLRRLRGF